MASSAASESLSRRSARASGCRAAGRDGVGAPDQDPGLRPAEQLVAREAHQVRAAPRRRARASGSSASCRGLEQRARAESSISGRPASGRGRPARDASTRSVKPTSGKFDWWTRSSAPVLGRWPARSRRAGCGSSCRPRAGGRRDCCEHLGDAEAVADLDQLPARDHDLAAGGQGGQRQQHRGGAVVDASAASAPVSSRTQRLETWAWREPRAPVVEVEFEVASSRGRRGVPRSRAASAAGRGRGWCAEPRRSR